jgi:hypothetical protein
MGGRLNLQASANIGWEESCHSSLISVQAQFFILPHVGLRLSGERRYLAGHPDSNLGESQRYNFIQDTVRFGIVARW